MSFSRSVISEKVGVSFRVSTLKQARELPIPLTEVLLFSNGNGLRGEGGVCWC